MLNSYEDKQLLLSILPFLGGRSCSWGQMQASLGFSIKARNLVP